MKQPKLIHIPFDLFDEWTEKRRKLRREFKTSNISMESYIISMAMLGHDNSTDEEKIKHINELQQFLNQLK